jgi:hypothetical protein
MANVTSSRNFATVRK